MVKVVIVAVPGAGKTTILRKVLELKGDVKVVNFGDLMYEVAKEKFGIKSRDDMRTKIEFNEYRQLQDAAASKIGPIDGNVIIDTHAAIKTPYGYYPGLPQSVALRMNINSIVFLEFRPEDIAARRAKDEASKTRSRGTESLEDIEEHQNASLLFAIAAANTASCYFVKMTFRYAEAYPYQHVSDAAERIIQHINALESMYR